MKLCIFIAIACYAVIAYGNPVEKMEREDPVENGHYEYKEEQQEVAKDEEQVNDPRGGSRGSRRSGWDKVAYGGRPDRTFDKCTYALYDSAGYKPYGLGEIGAFDDNHPYMHHPYVVSSFYRFGGKDCCLIFYTEPNYRGKAAKSCESQANLGDWNDKIASFRIAGLSAYRLDKPPSWYKH